MQAPEAFYQDQFASTACDKDDVGHLRRPAASALAECSPQVHNAVGAVVISCHVHSIATYFQDGLHVFKDQIGVIQWDYWINRNQPVFPEAHSRGGPQARRCAALFWARAAEHPSMVGKVWDLVAGR
jgi:hypothetical protein